MPIYEYQCRACGRKSSLFFRSISVVDPNPACPRCGEPKLARRMSRVWSRSGGNDNAFLEPSYEEAGVPFYGGDPMDYGAYDGEGFEGEADGEQEEDVSEFAREARAMAQMMGEPLDAEFDNALRHIEQGADPDDVFGEMDSRAPDPGETSDE